MENASTLRKNFIWNTVGSLTYFACQWLFTLLVVRLSPTEALSEANSGYLQTALAVTNMFLSVASYGMYNYQVSDSADKYAQSVYIRSRFYTCALSVGLCAGFVAFTGLVGAQPYTLAQCACIFLFLGYRLVESVTDVYNAIDQKHGRLDIVGKTYAARGVLSLVLFCAGLMATGSMVLTLALMLAGNLVFFWLFTLPQAKPFYRACSVTRRTVLLLLAECAPLAIYTVLSTAAASIPKIFLERMLGNAALGIYGPVTAPVILLQVCAGYLFTPFITVFSGCWARGDKRGFLRAFGLVQAAILALLPLGLLVAHYLGPWGLRVFIGQGYDAYAYLLSPMVFSAVLTATVLFLSMLLTVMRRMHSLIVANVLGIVVSAAVSVPFIRAWQLQGTTYAAVAALCVQALCLLGALLLGLHRTESTQTSL